MPSRERVDVKRWVALIFVHARKLSRKSVEKSRLSSAGISGLRGKPCLRRLDVGEQAMRLRIGERTELLQCRGAYIGDDTPGLNIGACARR